MIRRICLYGASCSGKSTLAADLFSRLKKDGINAELVTEAIKYWAYEQRKATGFDQVSFLAKQIRREERFLKNGVDLIITDSPLLLSPFYAKIQGFECWEQLFLIADAFDRKYPSLNFFLNGDIKFNSKGRYETKEERMQLQDDMRIFLIDCGARAEEIDPIYEADYYYNYIFKEVNS